MKDEQILEEVYRRVVSIAKNGDANVPSQVRFKEFKDFIEREWQREDEIEAKLDKIERKERSKKDDHPLTKSDEGQRYNIPCDVDGLDAQEREPWGWQQE